MRAVICRKYGTVKDLTMEDVEPPAMDNDGVRIRVRASGVSFAAGLVIAGKYQRKPPLPFIPGTEVAGEVIEVGNEVRDFREGDHVFATIDWGGWADQVIAKSFLTHPIPDGLNFAQATLLSLSYPTSYAALIWKAGVCDTDWVLVNGATGAVGLAAVEVAKARGARVIAAASTAEKRKLVTEHGADAAISYTGLRESVKEITAGRGANIVFDPIGGDIFMESLAAADRGGRLITIGYASGIIPKPSLNLLLVKHMSIIGLNYGTYVGWSPGEDGRAYIKSNLAMHADIRSMIQANQLRPIAHTRFPLDQFSNAYTAVETRLSVGKVVLEP